MRDHQFKCFEANTRHSSFAGGLADHAGAFALEHTLKVHRRRQRCLELILGMFLVLGALYPKARFYEIGLGVKQKGPPIEPSLSSRLFIIAGGLLAALDGIRRMTHHRVKTRGDRLSIILLRDPPLRPTRPLRLRYFWLLRAGMRRFLPRLPRLTAVLSTQAMTLQPVTGIPPRQTAVLVAERQLALSPWGKLRRP